MMIIVFLLIAGRQTYSILVRKEISYTIRSVEEEASHDSDDSNAGGWGDMKSELDGMTVPFYMYPRTEEISYHIIQVLI